MSKPEFSFSTGDVHRAFIDECKKQGVKLRAIDGFVSLDSKSKMGSQLDGGLLLYESSKYLIKLDV